MATDTILSYIISGTLCLLLTIVGTKITHRELRGTLATKKKQIAIITTHNYLISPGLALFLANLFDLDFPRSIALFVFSVIPSSPSASSVFTMLVKGDIPLAMSGSVVSTLSSFLLMPAAFWAQLQLYKNRSNNNNINNIRLPYMEITGILTFFTCSIAFGMLLKQKLSQNSLDLYKKYAKRTLILSIIAIISLFAASPKLVNNAFYYGPKWISHYGSIASFLILNPSTTLISTRLFCINDTPERDAIFFTVLRKNPAIPMAVASLSFKNVLSDEDYYTIVGIEFIMPLIMDIVSNPIMMFIRKKRLGYFCCKEKEHEQLQQEIHQEIHNNLDEVQLNEEL